MAFQLVEQYLEDTGTGFTRAWYTLKDDVTGEMVARFLKYATKGLNQKTIDAAVLAEVTKANVPPPPPPPTILDVLAKIDEVNADTKLNADEKMAALVAYKSEVAAKDQPSDATPVAVAADPVTEAKP